MNLSDGIQDVVGHVTVKTTYQGAAGKQDVVQVSLRDIDPSLGSDEVEALVHRAVVRAIIEHNKTETQ